MADTPTEHAAETPLMVYDGDCGFCRWWIERWRRATGALVRYAPYEEVADRYPDQTPFRRFVVLLEPDGGMHTGAEAVFRALARAPGRRWPLWLYRRLPGFRRLSEVTYRLVADRRRGFSRLTRLLWGPDPTPPDFAVARWAFLRLLGVVFLIAFISMWVQLDGLIGSGGILPVAEYLDAARAQLGARRFWLVPTLCWIGAGDGFLHGLCAAGSLLAVLLVVGVAPRIVLPALWAGYLSLTVVGQVFLSYQWDVLLLEVAFLAIFIAPPGLRPRGPRAPVPRVGRWLLWWLLFKLMFLSGITQLLSGDQTWRELTALEVHYETQPLPTWIGYWAHQLPAWMHKVSTVGMFVVEVAVPLAIFAPRRVRHLAALAMVLFQVLIGATGNYNFFNLLAIALCLLLLDDRLAGRLMPRGARERLGAAPATTGGPAWRPRVVWVAAALVMVASILTFVRECAREIARPQPGEEPPAAPTAVVNACEALLTPIAPFRTINGYGLFRVMTPRRPELIVEGTADGVTWRAYEFKWKPGDLRGRPRFVAPHQPRLDWQMWFAALNPRGHAWWLSRMMQRLLEGSEPVLALLEENPFPDEPPRMVRLSYYRYRFTTPATKAATGAWWRRELIGRSPPVSLPESDRRATGSP